MHTHSGHPIQKRISKLKQYKEEQPGLSITITPFFQCYGYDEGLRMAHIRREKMGYKTMLFKILNDIVCIPADQYLVSIPNTGRRHQQRLKLKQHPFLISMHS